MSAACTAPTLLPAAAGAAPLSLEALETPVPLLWPAAAGAALSLLLLIFFGLWLRLRSRYGESRAELDSLRAGNSRVHSQLQSSRCEVTARDRQLAQLRAEHERLRQESSDLLAIVGHHLRQPLGDLQGTLNLLARSGAEAELVQMAQRQQRTAQHALEEIQHLGALETLEKRRPVLPTVSGKRPAHPTRILNTETLEQQRDTLGQLSFAELLSHRIATLPKKTTAFTSALTGRHWLDARQLAQSLAATTGEIGMEAVSARLGALVARLAIDGEREYCRHQRTELLNLMRTSILQLKQWREHNMHSGLAFK